MSPRLLAAGGGGRPNLPPLNYRWLAAAHAVERTADGSTVVVVPVETDPRHFPPAPAGAGGLDAYLRPVRGGARRDHRGVTATLLHLTSSSQWNWLAFSRIRFATDSPTPASCPYLR